MPGAPPSPANWSALLMAGGESRRMGRDKATLVVGGEPLWKRQVSTLRAAGFEQIIVARADRESMDEPGLITVRDARPDCGPLGGLIAGLRQATTRWTLVLAVDLPLMPASFLRRMMEMAELDGRGVAPTIDGHYEPLAAVYLSPCLTFAEDFLFNGQWSMQALVEVSVVAQLMQRFDVPENQRAYFRNANTPEDLAEIERLLEEP